MDYFPRFGMGNVHEQLGFFFCCCVSFLSYTLCPVPCYFCIFSALTVLSPSVIKLIKTALSSLYMQTSALSTFLIPVQLLIWSVSPPQSFSSAYVIYFLLIGFHFQVFLHFYFLIYTCLVTVFWFLLALACCTYLLVKIFHSPLIFVPSPFLSPAPSDCPIQRTLCHFLLFHTYPTWLYTFDTYDTLML